MGVYINGMEMPKDCMECPFSDYEAWCLIPGVISEHCPLVEVPEPHGRLIDEDNVIDAIHERLHTLQTHKEFIKKRGDIDLLGVLPYISKIQTVIEAEGNE